MEKVTFSKLGHPMYHSGLVVRNSNLFWKMYIFVIVINCKTQGDKFWPADSTKNWLSPGKIYLNLQWSRFYFWLKKGNIETLDFSCSGKKLLNKLFWENINATFLGELIICIKVVVLLRLGNISTKNKSCRLMNY